MTNKASDIDLARRRSDMAELFEDVTNTTRRLEQWLSVADWRAAVQAETDRTDPDTVTRISVALMLRKARLHSDAAIQANKTGNMHSFAVQMRVVLECIGQIVFFFRNTAVAGMTGEPPESSVELVGHRLNADHYRTLRRMTKGNADPEALRRIQERAQEDAAARYRARKPKRNRSRSFREEEKVKDLPGGTGWYRYLSDRFTHAGLADWTGPSFHGGVAGRAPLQDDLSFLAMMDYLSNQLALMNAHAALFPHRGRDAWRNRTVSQAREVEASTRSLRSWGGR